MRSSGAIHKGRWRLVYVPRVYPRREGLRVMPKCGVCGDHYGELLVKHAELCEDDSKAPSVRYAPEIDDLVREIEEEEGND